MTLDEAAAHIGDGVIYRPYPGARTEDGQIVRVNTRWVFVLYRGDATPKATSADQLAPSTGTSR